jgi:hypothetical protein
MVCLGFFLAFFLQRRAFPRYPFSAISFSATMYLVLPFPSVFLLFFASYRTSKNSQGKKSRYLTTKRRFSGCMFSSRVGVRQGFFCMIVILYSSRHVKHPGKRRARVFLLKRETKSGWLYGQAAGYP